MSGRWTTGIAAVLSVLGEVALAAPAGMLPPDPAAAMRRIAALPYRYGGALQGTVPGVVTTVDQPPDHLSIGLAAPAPDGALQGEAILFTADRRLVAITLVIGRLAGGATPGTGACSLHLELPVETVTLTGVCTAATLSGEIVSTPRPGGLLRRLAAWWDDRAVAGRYWLTPASFDPVQENHGRSAT
ncbi:MAG: hypothetical protein ACRYG8_32045 [Janthinobacterium lividum]